MVVGDVTTAVDVLVLGAGPAGYVAAIRAAQLGKHVTLIDSRPPGGTCLHQGCIPLKALLSASERYQQLRQEELAAMGIQAEAVSFDWTSMQTWKQSVVDRLAEGVHRLVTGNRVEYVYGTGWFMNNQEARVEGEHGSLRFKFEHCIIAVGADAAPMAQLPYDGKHVLTPEQALMLPELPETLNVVGDDYIALELATLFARLDVKVKLYSPGEQILAGVDPAALRLVQAGLRKLGVQVVTKASIENVSDRPIVISQGVCPHTSGLHLDAAGIEVAPNGGIVVDTMQQCREVYLPPRQDALSPSSHIYAVGDCTGKRPLASIAIKQAKVAAEVIAGQRVQFAPLVTPLVVHTTPELATVGYSAAEATHAGYNIISGRFPLAANGRALTLAANNGVALVVANADDGVLLGATLVGPRAGDLIGQAALAIEMGATLTDLDEILYAHPSLSEALQEGVESTLGRAIHILAK
jgi:dihydrolipoamide dehydrogenase